MRERAEGVGGLLLVRSEPGRGTRFRLRFPALTPSAAETPAGPEEDLAPSGRPGA